MRKLDKFNEVYARIIAEENGFEVSATDDPKYNLTLLYGIGEEDLMDSEVSGIDINDENFEMKQYEDQALETLKKSFAPLGGIFTGDENQRVDVAQWDRIFIK